MITLNENKINTFNQISYNKLINSININQITCSCGHSGCLTKHAYYNRSLKIDGGIKITLSVLRLKCSICGRTHAILPKSIIPYSQISLEDHITIIKNALCNIPQTKVMNNNPLIDESSISHILRNFTCFWNQRLESKRIKNLLFEDIHKLVNSCFKYFSRQFMQIKCSINILHTKTHIT